VYAGSVPYPETEDLLRETLIEVGKAELGWDVTATAAAQPARPICDIFAAEINGFSKYRLARAFIRWMATNSLSDLAPDEATAWETLCSSVNRSVPT
jgi:hypothetical protein